MTGWCEQCQADTRHGMTYMLRKHPSRKEASVIREGMRSWRCSPGVFAEYLLYAGHFQEARQAKNATLALLNVW